MINFYNHFDFDEPLKFSTILLILNWFREKKSISKFSFLHRPFAFPPIPHSFPGPLFFSSLPAIVMHRMSWYNHPCTLLPGQSSLTSEISVFSALIHCATNVFDCLNCTFILLESNPNPNFNPNPHSVEV